MIEDFEEAITQAYLTTDRDNLWLGAALNIEAGELSELFMKNHGYAKQYSCEDVLSEAGDVLNFTAAILQAHGLTLEQAMKHNVGKIKDRGWI